MDFASLARDLLARSESLCREWFPNGKKRGHEYKIGDLSGNPGESLSINLNTGVWMDFASGETGGDFISLYASMNGIEQGEAFKRLTNGHAPEVMRNNPAKKKSVEPEVKLLIPVPDNVYVNEFRGIHPVFGHPSNTYAYRNLDSDLLGFICRYDQKDGKKQIVPWTYSENGWVMKQFPEPRPLYGANDIENDSPILVVEGEKCVDAAREFAGNVYAVVTWPGGAKAWQKADFSALNGRRVLLWPDADDPGRQAMEGIASRINSDSVKILDVSDMPENWDAADSGFTWETFKEWATPRAKPYVKNNTINEQDSTPEPTEEKSPFAPAINVFKEAPVPNISRDMLPDAIADYAFDQAQLIGVSPSMIAMPAIVACAAAIHDGIEIQPKRHETGWRESARLWCAVVGSPSVRKSPSLKRAVSRLKKINKEMCDKNESAMASYAFELEEWKNINKSEKKSGVATTPKPEEPIKNRLIVEDITVEALSEILKQNSRGVLCIQDELTGWFGSMDAYSGGKSANKDRAHWLEIYNGGHRMVDRVMRGSVSIPNWSACMVGGIQPDMIRRIANAMGEDGLMQRFMVIIGSNSGAEQDRPEDHRAKKAYGELIDALFAIQPSETPVTLSEDAHLIRESITSFSSELTGYEALPGGLKSHLGKWPGLFARLLLTYHVIECASRGIFPTTVQVSRDTALRVDSLMRNFLLPHAMSYYVDILGAASDMEHIRWIAGHILSKRLEAIEAREIMQAYRTWRSLSEWVRSRVMIALEEFGWIIPVGEIRYGRKNHTSWMVNPLVHEQFEKEANMEKTKRAAIREKMLDMYNIDNNRS